MLKFVPSLEDPEDLDTVIGEPQDLPEDASISRHHDLHLCAPTASNAFQTLRVCVTPNNDSGSLTLR
jgi:hypothetical protein